ncbi:hypothetical protein RDI58_000038 [Solanum bulbocastanum]|uniref:Uncharacterized protein n=1 Tax=Solanum bulbocastanum TaxID=147425 RepID=A0AAN8YM15_SOLBU
MLLKEFRYIQIQAYDRAGLESFFDNREISDVAAANEVHLSSSCVSKSDRNRDMLSPIVLAMAPSSSSTGSTTTSTTQILSDFSLEIHDKRQYPKNKYKCQFGNTHDDMLLAKLETVNIGSSDPGSSVVLPVWSEWLVFNKVYARARKGLVLGPMRLLLSFSGGHVVGNFPPHEAFVLGGTNSFLGMNIWSNGENDQTSSSKS